MKKVYDFFDNVKIAYNTMTKPTMEEEVRGTALVLGLAIAAAISISAVDSVFTALMGLFFR
jgi:preprotein translocase subunit SecE